MSRETYLEKLRKTTEVLYNEFRSCIVPKCGNSSITTPNKIFLQVPQETSRREEWYKAVGRKNVWPNKLTFCCEDHFDLPNDMDNWVKFSMTGCEIKMKIDVVPYKFVKKQNNYIRGKRRMSSVSIRKERFAVDVLQNRKPAVSILRNGNKIEELKTVKEKPFKEVQLKTEESMKFEESIQQITHFTIEKSPDIKKDTMPTYELVQNYTNEFFLVPLSEKTEQKVTKLNETDNIKNVMKKDNVLPKSKHKKIFSPLDENKIRKYEALINNQNNGIRKSEEVACNEKYHIVDIFTIFGKSVADQLRSFPVEKALSLQNKIQDLITQERLKL